ncbi:hypothetical protein BSL78_12014 [Apostichopus japonicus]|uniref:Uncharacterized protein n=1 Tax=Stichopus japonicus TaxID=307972 RepID=A0A2G8KSZ9_STIJA|nr:hypothetical protein BSL78_12014 [Apostichopus japonicus]
MGNIAPLNPAFTKMLEQKNRVHPTGNNKKQQRKDRKRRRLARLVQRINPFSCCTGDGVPKNVVCPETYLKSDKCITNKVITPDLTPTSVSPKISPQIKRSASAQSSASKASSRSNMAESPIATTATTATPLVSTETSRSSIVESPPRVTRFCLCSSTGSSSDDDSDGADDVEFNPQPSPKKYTLRQSPQKLASIVGSSRPPTYQRSHYSQLNARAFKSDSEESLTVTGKKSVSSDEFADCFEPQKTESGIRQQKEEPHEEPSGDDVTAPEKQKTYTREHLDLQNEQVEVSVEQICTDREEEEEEEEEEERSRNWASFLEKSTFFCLLLRPVSQDYAVGFLHLVFTNMLSNQIHLFQLRKVTKSCLVPSTTPSWVSRSMSMDFKTGSFFEVRVVHTL